jgi:hypothetical protein
MKRLFYLGLIPVYILLVAGTAPGAEFHVTNPAEFQNALTTAQANGQDDIILVASGDYLPSSPLTYSTNDGDGSLTIRAENSVNRPRLNGNLSHAILRIDNDADTDMQGDDNENVTISGLVFVNGYTSEDGGGLYIHTAKATILITTCSFEHNASQSHAGGGAYLSTINGSITITNCRFQPNRAEERGGGVSISSGSGTISLRGNTFADNQSNGGGAGAYLHTPGGNIILRQNSFLSNRSSHDHGGGIRCACDYGSVEISRNTFSGNSAIQGGGAEIWISQLALENNLFSDNRSWDPGAGVYVAVLANGTGGKGLAKITNNTLWNNGTSMSISGGGAYIDLIYKNSSVNLTNNIIRGNSCSSPAPVSHEGEDLYVHTTADTNGIVSYVYLQKNDLGDDADFVSGQSKDLWISDPGNYHQSANLTDDPRLTGNGHLLASSPAIDVGICGMWMLDMQNNSVYHRIAPLDDIDGDRRPGYGRTIGCDIGADEYKFSWPMFLPAIIHP